MLYTTIQCRFPQRGGVGSCITGLVSQQCPWSATTNYPFGVNFGANSCVTDSDYVYCVGGFDSFEVSNANYLDSVYFAPISSSGVGTWKATSDFPLSGYSVCVTDTFGYLYCLGTEITEPNPVTNFYYTQVYTCTGDDVLCADLNITLSNLHFDNCPPICTIPQGDYGVDIDANNPNIQNLQLIDSLQVGPSDPMTFTCVNLVCTSTGKLDFNAPGTWDLTVTYSAPSGAPPESLTFNVLVTPVIPTPEFPLGVLLGTLVPLLALAVYVFTSTRRGGLKLVQKMLRET
jgi:hypothetical protein